MIIITMVSQKYWKRYLIYSFCDEGRAKVRLFCILSIFSDNYFYFILTRCIILLIRLKDVGYMGEAYNRFWNLTFVNDERDTRFQFWSSMSIQFIILIAFTGIFVFLFTNRFLLSLVWLPLFLVGFTVIVWPVTSAVMRRVNDVGTNSLLFKRMKFLYSILVLVGAIIYLLRIFFNIQLLGMGHFNTYAMVVFLSYIIFLLWYCTLPSNFYKSNHELNHS